MYNLQKTAPDITALLHPRSGGTILTLEFPECSNVLRTRRASCVTQPLGDYYFGRVPVFGPDHRLSTATIAHQYYQYVNRHTLPASHSAPPPDSRVSAVDV